MNNKPMISVVMPNYNGDKYITETIKSVLSQTYTNIEIIIVDDASTDKSVDIINSFVQENDCIKLILNSRNKGVSYTRNLGIQESKGEYIALIDNDDLWESDKLERQLKIAQDGADIVYCSYDFIDETGKTIKRPFIVPTKATFNTMLSSSVISCSTAFIKASLLKQHLFNPQFYHEDYVLWMELLRIPVKAIGDTKVLMHYRQSYGSRSNKKTNAAKERWVTYRKALNLSLPICIVSFIRYSIKGVIKYYF